LSPIDTIILVLERQGRDDRQHQKRWQCQAMAGQALTHQTIINILLKSCKGTLAGH